MNAYMSNQGEADAIEMLLPHLKRLCRGKWYNLDPEDRLSEVSLFALQAVRSLPLNSGHFISDLQETIAPHMDAKNRAAPPKHYGREKSLDCQIATSNGTASWTYYDRLAGAEMDNTAIEVTSFLGSLPEDKRKLLLDLIDGGISKAAVARKYGMTVYLLKKTLKALWQAYQEGNWREK